MELFESPTLHRQDLFKSHKVKASGMSKYLPMMTKEAAYSKLSRSTKSLDNLIADKNIMINVLTQKQKKYPYRRSYGRGLSRLTAERDALKAEKERNDKDREELLRFTTAYAGRTIPADVITNWWVGRPLPHRIVSPEAVPEANQINIEELSTQPISVPTKPLTLGTSQSGLSLPGGEASGSLPMVSSGGTPFQPSGTQAPVEQQTGQGTPQAVEAGSLTEEEAMKQAGFNPSPSELSDIETMRGQPQANYQPRVNARADELANKYYEKNKKYGFLSSDTEPEKIPPRRRKKKEPKPEEVVIKKEEQEVASEAEEEPKGKEKEVVSEAEEEVKTNGSGYLSEKVKKVNAKEVEKYLKNYRIEFKNRQEFTEKFPRGNYVRYLNDLVKNDPEFWRYHNVVKKK